MQSHCTPLPLVVIDASRKTEKGREGSGKGRGGVSFIDATPGAGIARRGPKHHPSHFIFKIPSREIFYPYLNPEQAELK